MRVVALQIRAHHLHIDGGGQAEIQNLRDDIGGLEEKFHPGKPARQFLPQTAQRIRRWDDDAPNSSAIRISASLVPITPELL